MLCRCYNPHFSGYGRYGGRGIQVCERWRTSYVYFVTDVGLKPSSRHSLERINNNGNYEPSNCRWATPFEQGRNKRNNVLVTLNGVTKPLICWVEEFDVNYGTVYYRLSKGWAPETAFSRTSRGPSTNLGSRYGFPSQHRKSK
jgi:hypothetical protein